MKVEDGMSAQVLTVGPAHTLREAARMMAARQVGAAAAMVRGGFRHLVVVEGRDVVGLLSMRDIVRCWSGTRIPAQTSAQGSAQATQPA